MSRRRSIRLRLHAALRDAAGTEFVEVESPGEPTPRGVFNLAIARHPALAAWRDVVAFGTDERLLPPDAELPDHVGEIHALPPVSGG